MIKCPKCQQVDAVVRAGIARGKQRYACNTCQLRFIVSTPSDAPPARKRPITILDIAEKLGVSKSTVSRALCKHNDIHPDTRRAVLDLAIELDYQPNLMASGLLKNRSSIIGMIIPEFSHQFFQNVIIGAQQVLQQAGYNLLVCQSEELYSTEVANVRTLLTSQVDGLLVSITSQTQAVDHFRAVMQRGTPLVFFNRICPELATSRVVVDDYEGAFGAVEHLIGRGYRRIAHIAGPMSLEISRLRQQGYLDALQKHGLPADPNWQVTYDFTTEQARFWTNRLLDLPQPPDAIFAVNDPTAIEVMMVAKARRIQIPGELAVVGFSDDPISAVIEPGLTTVSQPLHEMGRTTAHLLLQQLTGGPDFQPITRVLKTSLIHRGSS